MGVWIWAAAAWAGCPEEPERTLRSHARALETAFEDVDEAGFSESYAALHAVVPCLSGELEPATVVAWHRARALGEFFEREEIASSKSWAAVKVLDPSYRPPESWMVPGTPLEKAWLEAPVDDARIELERSPAGGWRVDGVAASSVPASRAFVLQGLDSGGKVVHVDYHYSVAEVPVVDFEALDITARERRRKRMRRYGTVLAGTLGAGAVGTLAAAWTQERSVYADATPLEDLPVHAQRANALSGVGVGLGVAGLGVATATWSIRW